MQILWSLQYLRAVAACSVLLFHAFVEGGGHNALGTGGVDIFFVLSGYIMFELARLEPKPGAFALARIKRIVPAYWLVTGLVAAAQLAGWTERSSFDLDHVIKSLLFIPDLDVARNQIYPLLIVGWTLNYEMFFYAILTALLLIRHELRLVALAIIFAALLSLRVLAPTLPVALQFYSDPIILEFAFGAGISMLQHAGRLPARGWPFILIGVLLMIAPQPDGLHRLLPYGVPAAMVLLGTIAEETRKPVPRIRSLKLLGDASYSIYLWHLFAVTVISRLLGPAPPVFAVAVLGGIGLGLLSYFVIEKPFMALLRGRRVAPVPAG